MNVIILILSIVAFMGLYILYTIIADKIKILFGYKKYEYTRILSHGMKDEYVWHKTDEQALENQRNWDFISEVRPNKRTLKPFKK